jgi:hypothetical protein
MPYGMELSQKRLTYPDKLEIAQRQIQRSLGDKSTLTFGGKMILCANSSLSFSFL